ncbi:MAG: hypothetical protein HWD59_03065 [Coxiellaceae bacterium]|nr:MAG: hypothetical protein HWD59_03065 [Coxiellaceae bacterium]
MKKIIQIIGKTICAAGHPKIYIEALVQLLLHEDGKIGEHISQAFLGMCLQGFDWLEHYLEMFWELVKAQPPSLNLGVFMVMLANKDPKNWIVFVENNASSEYDNNVMLCLLTMYENPHNRELFSATMIDKLAMSLIKHGAKGYVIDDTTLATRVLYWLSHLLRSESSYDRFWLLKPSVLVLILNLKS